MDTVPNPPAEASTSKHTPGPWEVRTIDEPKNRVFVVGAIVRGQTADVSLPVAQLLDKADNVHMANARLIAAAPETKASHDRLLEACKAVMRIADQLPNTLADVRPLLETAIAKAVGAGDVRHSGGGPRQSISTRDEAAPSSAPSIEACRLIAAGPVDEPQINLTGHYENELFCDLEYVKNIQGNGYKACAYGFKQGVERTLEWAQGIVGEVIGETKAEKVQP